MDSLAAGANSAVIATVGHTVTRFRISAMVGGGVTDRRDSNSARTIREPGHTQVRHQLMGATVDPVMKTE
ncbi:ABC transporter g family member 29 [Mycolicibacterium canariasense]|uniref:ABC transporter g family member 29 n=1 Tax=Mycolicibacterium canariasense TaxID=228230 RepID=A0A100WGR1_MYCCR|nr:hypothetical protein AWB94_04475 [Mycolicibacterium canariasense]GAS97886.1 ABC transporter g family member 29 [Mycolicibacterium canariasense]